MLTNIAIFASGSGSNAREIIRFFKDHKYIKVSLIITNKSDAGVLDIARDADIPYMLINRESFYKTGSITEDLQIFNIDLIVLAGFLWLIPSDLIKAYSEKILNIHPSLLPKYGGKGMFGHHVHEAVKANNDKISGMTIHIVNEKYDEGNIIFQEKCEIKDFMTPEDIAKSVLKLEHKNYSRIIEQYIYKFCNRNLH